MGEETEIFEQKRKISSEVASIGARKIFTLVSGYLVLKGILPKDAITTDMIESLVGSVMVIISIYWSLRNQKRIKEKASTDAKN